MSAAGAPLPPLLQAAEPGLGLRSRLRGLDLSAGRLAGAPAGAGLGVCRGRRAAPAGRLRRQPPPLEAASRSRSRSSRSTRRRTARSGTGRRPRSSLTSRELQRSARFSADASHQLKTPVTVLRAGLEELLAGEYLSLRGPRGGLRARSPDVPARRRHRGPPAALEDGRGPPPDTVRHGSTLRRSSRRGWTTSEPCQTRSASRIDVRPSAVALDHGREALRDAHPAEPPRERAQVQPRRGPHPHRGPRGGGLGGPVHRQHRPAGAGRRRRSTSSSGSTAAPWARTCPGHGIGLNLARELARLHGGDLRLARSDDDWTEFEVRFRLAAAAGRAPGPP